MRRTSHRSRTKSSSTPASHSQRSRSGSTRVHSSRGRTRIPVFGRSSISPLAARTLTDSRRIVRLTLKWRHRSPSVESPDSSLPIVPRMIPRAICRVNWTCRRSRRIMVPPFSLRLSESVFRFFCYHTTFWHADVNGRWFRPAARPENDLRAPQLPQPLLPALPVLSLTVPLVAPHQVFRSAPEEVDPLADAGGFAAG